jgi:hypothetical protein
MIQIYFKKENTLNHSHELLSFGYKITHLWLYAAGLLLIIKSFFLFKNKDVALGVLSIGFFLVGILFLIYARHIASFLFIIIYGTV